MKALSIHPYYAMAIVTGLKRIELRTWKTDYRGDILICSTATKNKGTIPGHAIGVVELLDVLPFQKKECDLAMMNKKDWEPGLFGWHLGNNRLIEPIPVKGKLSLWNYDDEDKIIFAPDSIYKDSLEEVESDDLSTDEWFKNHWEPIII